MKNLFLLLFLFLPAFLFSQINDDFEDGNLTGWTESSAGHWEASNVNPINGNYSLHQSFDNPSAGHDQISIPFGFFDITSQTTSWRFQIRHEYTPSTSNNWVCFLFSDQDAAEIYPSGSANGYAVGVNYSGSDDFIKVWEITSGSGSEILNTGYNWETNIGTNNAAGIEVLRTSGGEWSVLIDNNGGFDNLQQIGTSIINSDYTTTNYAGFYYEYSSAQDRKLYIDNFYVGAEIADTIPPYITQLSATSNNSLTINFNEDLDQTTAETIGNYSVDGSIGNPISASLNGTNPKEITLSFSETFTDNTNYMLTVNNVEDLSGNATNNETANFSYVQIAALSVIPTSVNTLDVLFNKALDITTAQTSANYSADGSIGTPTTAILDGTNDKLVHLTFASDFVLEQNYILTVSNVEDTYGNTLNTADLPFTYYITQAFDVVINEIMNDVNPAPEVLPAQEYIEIYNNSAYDINLNGWTLTIGTNSPKVFPSKTLTAGGYAIICEADAETDFAPYGTTIGILNSSELTITEKQILIKTSDGTLIEDITYSKDWYHNADKDDGGWSMERIDPTNFCGGETNWSVTEDYTGGTPGRQNSVFASNPDNTAPNLVSVKIISSNQINLIFDENISSASASEITNFSVNNNIGNPSTAYIDAENKTLVRLFFTNNFADKQNYQLMIENLSDNCGNIIQTIGYDFTYHRIHPSAIWVKADKRLQLEFSETVDFATSTDITNYSCDKGIGNPELVIREALDSSIIHLQFATNFPEGEEIRLSVSGIKDINGNTMNDTSLNFIYYTPKLNDIAINEILFNAFPDGTDFVELYNRTEYPVDVINLKLAKRDTDNPDSIIQISPLSDENRLIEPASYFAFTTSKEDVLRFYMSENADNIYEIPDIPTFPDDKGTVVLLYKDTTIIDEFSYNENMHFPLLDDNEGVSLERVNFNKSTQDASNWHSASELVGFATPAYKNSQFNDGSTSETDPINIDPHVFSPNNDGFNDYANINFKFDTPDNVASIYIFDAKGRIIKKLAESLLLSVEGSIVWNGIEENGRLAPIGTYVVYIKIFDAKGTVSVYKKSVILAKKI